MCLLIVQWLNQVWAAVYKSFPLQCSKNVTIILYHICWLSPCSVAKVEVVVEHIMQTKVTFSEDRRKPSISFNEEQIHKYEKYAFTLWLIIW